MGHPRKNADALSAGETERDFPTGPRSIFSMEQRTNHVVCARVRPESRKVYPVRQPGVLPGDDNDGRTDFENALDDVGAEYLVVSRMKAGRL